MARRSTQRSVKSLTVSAMLCALGVVLLALGSLIDVIDLTTAVIASLLCTYAVIELGGAYPWGIWAVTSLVAFLLLPIKTPALFYALFFGFYPMLKMKAEKRNRVLEWGIKLCTFHLSAILLALFANLFFPSLLEGLEHLWMILLLYAVALLAFILYDICLTRLITLYLVRLRTRFRIK